ncbi:MAG: LamG-like jellyroll fold domain-containing protein [Sphingobacteriales bacterium]
MSQVVKRPESRNPCFLLKIVFSGLIFILLNVNASAALPGYAFSKPLVLNTSQIIGGSTNTGISSTLTNFPALVYIKDDALKISTTCSNLVQYPYGNYGGSPAGTNYDFAFTAAGGGTELKYEVDTYDQVDGILLVWVQIPSMTKVNTSLDFYFGSLAPAHGTSFTQSTWPSDYYAVYHFDEGSNTAAVLDATSNGRNAVQTATTTVNDEIHIAAGIPIIGGAYNFNGTSTNIIQNAGTTTPAIMGVFTESAWVYATNAASDNKIMSNEVDYTGGYKLSVTGNLLSIETRNSSGTPKLLNAGAVPSSWTYIQGVYDGTKFTNYVNGVATTTGTGQAPAAGGVLSMGEDNAPSFGTYHYYTGAMDEVRISNVVKTADWIKAEYYNQTHPLTFTDNSGAVVTYQATAALIPGALTYTWTGATSTDPSVASNWNNTTSGVASQAPAITGTSTLIIPVSAQYPSLTGNLNVYGLTLNGGASIALNGHVLNVACNIYNQGTGNIYWGNNDASGITWNGTSAQSYNGNAGTSGRTQVGTMIVNNSGGATVTINGDSLDIYHALQMQMGNLAVAPGGFMALKSSRIETANVNQMPSTCSIIGNVTAERYIPGGTAAYRSYRLLTLPVNISSLTNNQTSTEGFIDLSSLNNGIITAGPGTGFSYLTKTANPLMYLYDESRAQNFTAYVAGKNVGIYSLATSSPYKDIYYPKGASATPAPVASAALPVGNSVQVYYVGPYVSSPTLSATAPAAATTSATGYLNQGTIPVYIFPSTSSKTLSYSPAINTLPAQGLGLNQVGNPYASTIDLDSVYFDNKTGTAAIGPSFWELKQPSNIFVAYNAASHTASTAGSGAEPYVASGQGFYVQAISATSALTFYEKEKVNVQLGTSTTPVLILSKRSNNYTPDAEAVPSGLSGLHLQMTKDSINYVQTGIYFNSSWNDKYSPQEDAIDMGGFSPKVYLSSYSTDNVRLSINQLGDYTKGKTVKLYTSATSSGSYTISLADINNIDALYTVYLRDHVLNDSVDLRTSGTYSFTINTSDTSTYGGNRFDLVIALKKLPACQLFTFAGQKANSGVQLNWVTNNASSYTGFVLQKQGTDNTFTTIYTAQGNGGNNYSFVDSRPIIGNNTYRLVQRDVYGNSTYSSLVTIGYNNISSNGYFSIYPNPSKSIINILVNSTATTNANYTADIYNTSGILIDHRILNTYTWTEDVSSYKEGVYIIALKNINGDALELEKFIKIK